MLSPWLNSATRSCLCLLHLKNPVLPRTYSHTENIFPRTYSHLTYTADFRALGQVTPCVIKDEIFTYIIQLMQVMCLSDPTHNLQKPMLKAYLPE